MRGTTSELPDLLHSGYRFALSLTHDASGAEDLVQDAWLAVLKAGGPWSRAYLFTAIRSRFADRRRGREPLWPLPLDEQAEAEVGAGREWKPPGPDSSRLLDDALGRLRPEERSVLYLAAVEEWTAREIADWYGWPRGTVLSLIHRAKGKLRRWMEPRIGVVR